MLVHFQNHFVSCDEYEDNIQFVLYNNGRSSVSTFNKSVSEQCDVTGKFSFITHGWLGSASSWIPDLIGNLSVYRTGCIVFMNYSYYSDRLNYLEVLTFYEPITNLAARKLQQLNSNGVLDENIFMFGFSLGGRIVINAAIIFGPKRISSIDSECAVK